MPQEYRQPVYRPPEGACDILLIRHGESMPARPGESFPMKDGHGDPPLHPNGHSQASAVGDRLRHERFDALYVTTLQRTHQTAAPLALALGMTPMVEPDLREVCLGEWDGGEYRIRAANRDPIYVRMLETQDWGVIPGAESSETFMARVRAGIERIAAAHPDQRVAAFVHGGVVAAAMALASGARPMAFAGAANGSISRVVLHNGAWTVRGFNDCSHL